MLKDIKFTDRLEERSFYTKLLALPAASYIRLIDHRDYFTVHDENAEVIADQFYKTSSIVKDNNGHKYVSITTQNLINILKFCLIENAYKVEVYTPKLELIVAASPGNLEPISLHYQVELEPRDASAPVAAAIKTSQKKIGVCLVDLSNQAIKVSEFEDSDLFANLESLLIQLGVKEVILSSEKESPHLLQLLDKLNIVTSVYKSLAFSNKDMEQDLTKLLCKQDENVELVLGSKGINTTDFPLAFASLAALIDYLDLLTSESAGSAETDPVNGGGVVTFDIGKYDLERFMKLDSSTLRALNIFPMTERTNQTGSVFELLNKCKTSSGSRLLSQWLKQPLTDKEEILERQDLVELFINDTTFRLAVQEFLAEVPDIKRVIKRIVTNTKRHDKKLEDVVRLYQLYVRLPDLIGALDSSNELVNSKWLQPLEEYHGKLNQFQGLVETSIDLAPLLSGDYNAEFNVNPDFEDSLKEVNLQLQQKLLLIKQQHEIVAEDLGVEIDKKLKLEKHQIHGWCFRVTRNDSVVLRNTSYTELQTVKAGVFFTNKALAGLSREHAQILKEYNQKQRDLIQEILLVSLTFEPIFIKLSLVLSHMDVLLAFADTAIIATLQYTKPQLIPLAASPEDAREISLKESRHPILEAQDDFVFIPNDVALAENRFAVITGPNMGGKSTYIRQIGVIALLAQIGSLIPAKEGAIIPIFDSILSRVGAGDLQLKGLSTFMIEMLETSSILQNSTHNSLVIIDELGRGTSTYDGFGLAYAISEHLIRQTRCFLLFATHFHELTRLESVETLQVRAVIGDNEDLTLMYKVEPGISSKSFGINVAELVKFPSKIINMAKRKASELQEAQNQDDYIKIKRTKCTQDEISEGIEKLKQVVGDWKSECFSDGRLVYSPEETLARLRGVTVEDKFVREIVEFL